MYECADVQMCKLDFWNVIPSSPCYISVLVLGFGLYALGLRGFKLK
jgi:hypothetical protein